MQQKIPEIEVKTKTETGSTTPLKPDDLTVNTVRWAGTHFQLLQSVDMRNEILLDTASSASLFGNIECVDGITQSKRKLELHTNGGPILSSEIGLSR
jgi:hypothetical protein